MVNPPLGPEQPLNEVTIPFVQPGTGGTFDLSTVALPSQSDAAPERFTMAGELLFFTHDDGIHGEELWVTDGTPEGTRLVKDILVPNGHLSSD